MRTEKKKLPIGIENFAELQRSDFYYIDKTNLIKELLTHRAKGNLFTRPRRFGKSLNMSMLKHFFELGGNKEIFDNLKIAEESSLCEEYMGKFPVISVSLKESMREPMKKHWKWRPRLFAARQEDFSIFWTANALRSLTRRR